MNLVYDKSTELMFTEVYSLRVIICCSDGAAISIVVWTWSE